jgi:F-type H+-transporting ATPase subunit alpha
MLQRLHSEHQELMDKLRDGEWDDSIESELRDAIAEAIDDFGPDFDAEGNPIEEGESDRIRRERQRDREASGEDGGDGTDSDSGEGAEQTEEQQAAPA